MYAAAARIRTESPVSGSALSRILRPPPAPLPAPPPPPPISGGSPVGATAPDSSPSRAALLRATYPRRARQESAPPPVPRFRRVRWSRDFCDPICYPCYLSCDLCDLNCYLNCYLCDFRCYLAPRKFFSRAFDASTSTGSPCSTSHPRAFHAVTVLRETPCSAANAA